MTFAAASCGDPGSPENGYRTGGVFTFGNKLTFHCQRGYEMKGASKEIECQSNGRWSGTLPTCEGNFESFQFGIISRQAMPKMISPGRCFLSPNP